MKSFISSAIVNIARVEIITDEAAPRLLCFDTVSSADLKANIEGYDSKGCDIDFDLTGVEYISSAGLRLLVALQKQVKADGKQLTLRNPNKVVKEVFSVAGFSKAFNIV